MRSPDVTWHPSRLEAGRRHDALRLGRATVWFTGLPASGKSTLAAAVEEALVGRGTRAYLLDGDNLRHGLNGDLGFGPADRAENVRRTAHVAAILADSGCIALVSLVSPYAHDRQAARAVHVAQGIPFLEVWVSTPVETCARRDPKGLYARAHRGELTGLTGVDAPYEAPTEPDVEVDTEAVPVEVGAQRVVDALDLVLVR